MLIMFENSLLWDKLIRVHYQFVHLLHVTNMYPSQTNAMSCNTINVYFLVKIIWPTVCSVSVKTYNMQRTEPVCLCTCLSLPRVFVCEMTKYHFSVSFRIKIAKNGFKMAVILPKKKIKIKISKICSMGY